VKDDGPSPDVVSAYLRSVSETPLADHGAADGPVVSIRGITVRDAGGHATDVIHREQPFTIEIAYVLHERVPGFDLALYLINDRGVRAIDEALRDAPESRPDGPGTYSARLTVPPVLNTGGYSIGLWVGAPRETYFHDDAVATIRLDGSVKGRPDRIVELKLPWEVRSTTSDDRRIG
jgi:hypothetical protein